MKNIFIESVNRYMGLNEVQKDAVISLYRTLFEDGAGYKPAAPAKKEEKKEDKKEEPKDEKKEDKQEPKQDNSSEGGEENFPANWTRNRTPINMQRTDKREVKYIALHYTAGGSSKAGQATRTQFTPGKKASADFIVDDGEVYQYNPDLDHYYTFAVGAAGGRAEVEKYKAEAKERGMNDAARYYGSANYKNTLSIEMCSNYKGGIKDITTTSALDPNYYLSDATLANTAKLVAWLLKKYPGAQIIRHYDITGKPCPGPWCRNNEGTQQFMSFVQRCHGTPAPADPEYDDVEDALLPKNSRDKAWPDLAREFAPDATATTAESDAAMADMANQAGIIGDAASLIQSMGTPVTKVLAEIIKKSNAGVPNVVIKEFIETLVKKPELLKNVLKVLPQK